MADLPPDPSRGMEHWRIRGADNHTYWLQMVIDTGRHWTTYRCLLEGDEQRRRFTCKVITKRGLDPFAIREIRIMAGLQRQNVLALNNLLENDEFLFLIMPFLPGGTLCDILEDRTFSEAEARRILMQIARGLAYLHGEGICHNNLTLDNIVCTEGEEFDVFISSFDLSTIRGERGAMEEFRGSLYYAAPEVVRHEEPHIQASDIWSFGVIAYALLTRSFPFDNPDLDLGLQILRGEYNTAHFDEFQVSDAARQFIARIFRLNPNERPTASYLVYDDPWLNGQND